MELLTPIIISGFTRSSVMHSLTLFSVLFEPLLSPDEVDYWSVSSLS